MPEKDALILAQAEQLSAQAVQITALQAQIATLEAKLGQPPKTPANSSLPGAQGEKANRGERRAKRRQSHPGVARALAADPDHVVEAYAETCPHCAHALSQADQPEMVMHDHIELPPIRPVITRVHRHRGLCPACQGRFCAPAPPGLAAGSPFGPGVCALVVHLHATQAIGFERLARLLDEVFGVSISEGALVNILARAKAPLVRAAEPIAAAVRQSAVVGSDETTARVAGKTWWQWVLLCSTAICHVIVPSRAAAVVADFLDGHRPQIWVADRYAAQTGHGAARQLCLAHLLRDAQDAIDAGDSLFAFGFKLLLLRAMAIGRRRPTLKDSTLQQYQADLERRLDRLLSGAPPDTPAASRLFNAMRRDRDDLFRFVTRRDVPYTNNACERALRPSVIFRKVTGCFRSPWGAEVYAAAASVIATGRLHGLTALQAMTNALAGKPIMPVAA
ncbi:MAG TPA: IS66 family transposase [Acetobacteraceae bacterium]